jgi:hypothetical protein
MATELGKFFSDQLARLPQDHPDRRFLEGLATSVAAYNERTTPGVTPTEPTERPVSTERETQERVRFSGRLGAPPVFRTTAKGRFVARLAVAERMEGEEKPTWHTVFAFDERARRLQAKGLSRGAAVEVIGYEHVRTGKTREGKPKTVTEIYAVGLRTL